MLLQQSGIAIIIVIIFFLTMWSLELQIAIDCFTASLHQEDEVDRLVTHCHAYRDLLLGSGDFDPRCFGAVVCCEIRFDVVLSAVRWCTGLLL